MQSVVELAFGCFRQVVPLSIELVLQSMHSTVVLFGVDAHCKIDQGYLYH